MFNFVFDKKSFTLLIALMTMAGGLLFFAGLLVGVNWGLPAPSQIVYSPPAVPVSNPCPEPQPAAPAPVPVRREPAPQPQVVEEELPPPPVREEPPVRTMTASLRQPVQGPYSVQVGAFRSQENSEEAMRDLESRGYEPYVVPLTTRKRNVLHTVRIGRYATRQEAEQAAAELREREQLDTIIQRNRTEAL